MLHKTNFADIQNGRPLLAVLFQFCLLSQNPCIINCPVLHKDKPCQSLLIYRIIPNKRAGRGDEVGGAFIMCTKMLICISRQHSAAAPSLSHATLVRTDCTCKPPSTLTPPLVRAGSRCNWWLTQAGTLCSHSPLYRQARQRGYHYISSWNVLIWARRNQNMLFVFRYIRIIEMGWRHTV